MAWANRNSLVPLCTAGLMPGGSFDSVNKQRAGALHNGGVGDIKPGVGDDVGWGYWEKRVVMRIRTDRWKVLAFRYTLGGRHNGTAEIIRYLDAGPLSFPLLYLCC